MAERIANQIVLVEDVVQQNLVRRYLERCGHSVRGCRFLPLPAGRGSGEKYVRDNYAAQVVECRSRGNNTKALLVVMIDADTTTVANKHQQLARQLTEANAATRQPDEPIAVLIPKRHVETWIRALLGEAVDESNDYKRPVPGSAEVKQAAEKLHVLTRPGSETPANPPSLAASIDEWRKVP